MCGCGRTSWFSSGVSTTGPKWSKKMNGPTLRCCTAGSKRRTTKPPPRSFSCPASVSWTAMSALHARGDIGNARAKQPPGFEIPLRHVGHAAVGGRLRHGAAVRHQVVHVIALRRLEVRRHEALAHPDHAVLHCQREQHVERLHLVAA